MSTRSRVGVETESGIHSIYIHFDGYAEGVGAKLENHWSDPAELMELIEQGDLQALGVNLGWVSRAPVYEAAIVSKEREEFRALTKAQRAHFAYLRTPLGWLGKRLGWDYVSPIDGTRYCAADSPWLPIAALAQWTPSEQQTPP